MPFISVHVVHPYSSTNIAKAWKKSCFISSDRSDFHMFDYLLIAVYTFTRYILTSLSVDETRLLRYVNLSNNFIGPPRRMGIAPSHLKHMYRFICIRVETNAFCCLLQVIQVRFALGWCTCKKCYIICIIRICYSNLLSFCLDVAQGCMNGAPNETQTHSCRFGSLAC